MTINKYNCQIIRINDKMIKEINFIYECKSCGTTFSIKRIIEIDEYLKKIEIIRPIDKCKCGKIKYKLTDIEIHNFKI